MPHFKKQIRILFLTLLPLLVFFVRTQGQINLNNGLIAYYPFSGNANDISGNNHHGVLMNGPQLTTDRSGTPNSAYRFDGIDDFIKILNSPGLNPTNGLTISLLFNPEQNGLQTLIGKIGYNPGLGTQFQVAMDFGPQPGVLFGVNPFSSDCFGVPLNAAYANTGGSININQWYCMVGTFENGFLKIYLNGVLIETVNAGFTNLNQCTNADIQIGSWWSGDLQRFKGKIDEVRIYNRALNQQEVSALCETPTSCTNWLKTTSTGDYVTAGDVDVTGNKLTVEVNFNRTAPANSTGGYGFLVSKHTTVGDINYALWPNGCAISTTNGDVWATENCNLQLNKTYHVAMVYDGVTLKFYRNGFLMNQSPASGNLVNQDLLTTIAQNSGVGYPEINQFIGVINEVRIWNVARTQAEIQTYMNTSLPSPATQTGLLAYYTFDDLLNKQGNPAFNGSLGGTALINQVNPNCTFVPDNCCVTPEGTLTGSIICAGGSNGSLTFNASAGTGPFTLTYTDGTNVYIQPNVQSGVPFNVASAPLVTTTYTLQSIQGSGACLPVAVSDVTATVIVNNCTLCTGSLGDPVVNITFGSGNNPGQPLQTIVPGASTTLTYVAVTGNPAAPTPFDGQYTITNNIPFNAANWHRGNDHTPGDTNGFMAFYNSQETAGLEFYKQTISNLCGSTTYEFAAWVANCLNSASQNGVDPDITFRIERTDGTLIASYNTGAIPETFNLVWKQYGFFFTMPASESTVVLKMINNSVGGNALPGNDLAIDDITFRPCGPTSTASFSSGSQIDTLTVCEGDPVTLFGNLSTGYNTPNYRWQSSIDNGLTWIDIPSSNLIQFSFTTTITGTKRTIAYRMVAAEGTSINSLNCRVGSNKIVLRIRPQILCSQQPIGSPISGIINSYTEVIRLDICKNSLIVSDATEFNIGDTVIIAQMKGAKIDSTNSPTFGTLLNYRNAGNYEFNYISQKNGNELILRNELLRTYDIPDGIVQLVRVPYYTSATVTADLKSRPWNGRTGGILALNVRDTLILKANMDVSGQGFSGGKATNVRALVSNCSHNSYNYPSGSNFAAPKGESITSIGNQLLNGKGAPASGGGGGVDHNSGGGGGGNGGTGGFGGYQLEVCTGSAFDNRGIGGRTLDYTNTRNAIFLGGGGGAGHCNQPLGVNMDGGNGGGIIILKTGVLLTDYIKIQAKGANAVQCNLPDIDNCHDGSGGGGGGGTILLETNTYPLSTEVEASGGKGGDLIIFNNVGGGRIGPGGGGGGGVIWFNAPAQPAQVNVTNLGGSNGVILMDNNNPWGTTPGQPGISLLNLRIPISTQLFEKNIDTVRLVDSVINCKNVRFHSTVITRRFNITSWHWNFGDGVNIVSQTGIVTHEYPSAGTYPVKLIVTDARGCQDSIEISVTVDDVTANISAVAPLCINQSVTLNGSGGSNYSWTPAQYLNDSTLQNPIANVQVTTRFYLKVSNNSSCYDTASILVTVLPKTIFNAPTGPNAVCEKNSLQLNGNNNTQYTYAWSPSTFLNDPTSPNPVATPDSSITYAVRISESVCNYDSNFTLSVIVNPKPVVTAQKANDIDCNNPTSLLQASGADRYTWSPSVGLDNSNKQNPIAAISSNTTYIVTGTNRFGCMDTATVSIKVTTTGKATFVLPNAFTPNGDGKNDCFGIRRWGNVTIKEFSIFNRWGQMVFSTKDPTQCWDGTINGKKQDTGGFTYVILASSICGEIKKTGIIMLIR